MRSLPLRVARLSYACGWGTERFGAQRVRLRRSCALDVTQRLHDLYSGTSIFGVGDLKLADKAFKARGGFVIDCNTGAGHCGGGPLAGDVWKFFQAHPFAVIPEPWTGLPLGFSTKCMIQ